MGYREFTGKLDDSGNSRFIEFNGSLDGDGPDSAKSNVLKTILLNNPVTAAVEAGANFGSQIVSVPVSGLAGVGAAAAKAAGLTDANPADVVRSWGSKLTYEPRGEMGKAAAGVVAYPFEKLAEAGQYAGDRVLDASGSPVAATAADTAVNALPLLLGAKGKGRTARTAEEAKSAHGADAASPADVSPTSTQESQSRRGFVSLEDVSNVSDQAIPKRVQRLESSAAPMHEPQAPRVQKLRGTGDSSMSAVAEQLPSVPGGHGAEAVPGPGAWADRREPGVQPGELRLAPDTEADGASERLPSDQVGWPGNDYRRGFTPLEETGPDLPGAIAQAGPDRGPGPRLEAGTGTLDRVPGTNKELEGVGGRIGVESHDPGFPPEKTSGRASHGARYALIEADDLKASHDTTLRPVPENPFGRQGVAHGEQAEAIQGIVRDFAPERLTEAVGDADGAPIVARDGVVEAGQRRAIALQRVYEANGQKAHVYRQHLRDNAERFGIAPEAVDQMKRPVLVRVPDEPAPREAVRAKGVMPQTEVQDMASGVQNSWAPGQNYVPLMDQTAPAVSGAKSVTDLPAPIRREQIVKDFAAAVGTTVYEGRVKGKNRLGFFRPGVEEVRTKRANDLEVAAHEVAHLIDSRVPELSRAWRNDKALREELKSVSYDQQSVSEGFAEGVRLFLTQPETLEAKAPKVHAWLEGFAAKDKTYGPALRTAQERMTAWFGQDALNRARSKIGTDKPLAEYFDRFWDKFRQSVVDDLHGVYRMERDLKAGKIDPVGPYESARLSRASASIADGAVRFGYPVKQADGSFKFAGRGLEEILQPVAKSLDDALLYFVGRSSAELMGQGREHLFTKGEIDAMLRLRTPEREQAFKDYQTWNKGVLDFAEAQGVINPEARRLWQRTQYLPFHRVEQPGGLKGKPGDWSGIQQLTGGTTNIKDVLGNMIGNAAMLIDKAVKNEARVKIAKLALEKGGGKFMVKIDTGAKPVKISGDQVIEAMLKKYGIAVDGNAPAFFQFMVHGQPPAGGNVVAVLQHGKPVWFEVGDPILYRALKAIDRPIQSEVVRWLGLPKRIGQAAITATPDFWMANIARDTIMGSVMSRAGFRPVLDSLKGMTSRMTKDPIYRDYLANGGGLSSYFLDERHLRTKLEKFYRGQGIDYRTVLDAPDKLLSFIETLGDAFEMSTRLGEYKRAIERGENSRHAAYLGRDVSTDFAMKGDSKALGFMCDTVMFLRPALVSWDRLYRGLAHDPNKGAIAAKAGTIALMSAGLYLLNRDDSRYQDLPDWDRDTNWHFFIGDQHFRWPKIWEVGAVASLAERSTEKMLNDNPGGLGEDFARILGATFNLNTMPQLVAPLYEQATNRNSFTKAPIETPGMENVQPFLRVKPSTSETMKALGRATGDLPEYMQVNPVRAEALLRGYFNSWATYGLMLTDRALFGDQLPAKRTDELPVVRRFYSQEPAKHTRYESEFYDMLKEAQRLRGTMKELDDLGRSDWADRKEQSPLAGEAKPLERAAKNLGAINRDMESVRRDASLTAEQKRDRLDALTVERNGLLKAAVTESKFALTEKAR